MTTEHHTNHQSGSNIFPDSAENIAMGAKVFSEKASDIFNTFLEKVKETAESAYEKGSQIYENMALTAQGYLDKFRDRNEMVQLKEQRDEVATQLGYMCFMEYSGRYRFRVEFMKGEEFKKLLAQIRELDKQIIDIGKRLDTDA